MTVTKSSPTEEVRAATDAFYSALDALLKGETQAMNAVWHHGRDVSAVHMFGEWAHGWPDVWASWQQIATLFSSYRGHADRAERIGSIQDLRIAVSGDTARTTAVLKLSFYTPQRELKLAINCSNVLERRHGTWKMVHHHADQAPGDLLGTVRRLVRAAG